MNLKHLDRKTRSLVEALVEPATEENYEITDVEEDGDTITVTFSRDGSVSEDDLGDEYEE